MDPPSEFYRVFLRLFHTDLFEALAFTEAELNKAGLLGDGESSFYTSTCCKGMPSSSHPAPLALVSHPERGDSLVLLLHCKIYAIPNISLTGVSELAAQVVKTMKEHPELLSESFNFFPRLYRT
jgi:hypothetical protein